MATVSTGAWVLVVAVVVAVGFGLLRRRTDGRFRDAAAALVEPTPQPADPTLQPVEPTSQPVEPVETPAGVLAGTPFAGDLGERATLLQFSSAFCAPCRATRRVLGEVVEVVPGVAHVEVDAEQHLDLVRRVNVLRTPTTLVLDAEGREVTRAAGAPTRAQVLTALGGVVDA